MNTQDVCYNFTRGIKTNCQDGCDGHNSGHNVFYEGDILYSYGYHYPLAIRAGVNTYLVNCSGYSNSTAKHTNHFYSAVSYSDMIEAPTQAMQAFKSGNYSEFKKLAIEYQNDIIKTADDKLSRARLDHTKRNYILDAKNAHDMIEEIAQVTPDNDKPQAPESNQFASIAMVAKMGVLFSSNQVESNDWKKRMLLAGLEGRGLSMPDDWDSLPEEEKTTRLDKVINQLGE